ncbi:MAG: HD domain-containing protein [Thermoplasmataceae archaeon]
MCHLVFPGANHSRFEHSLGTSQMAVEFADAMNIEPKNEIAVAALLHDVGHPPLSHAIEDVFREMTGMDHLEAGIRMILGEYPFQESGIPNALDKMGVSPKDVASILNGKFSKKVVSKLISGPVDVDELDYLRRDSHYTGVSIGNVDYRRIMNVASVEDDQIVIKEKGISTLESILIARILMYRGVYFHKTARIAQIMAAYALRDLKEDFPDPFSGTDFDLFGLFKRGKSNIGRLLLERRLYKPIFRASYSKEDVDLIKERLESMSFLEETDYIVDIVPPLEFSGPERTKSGMLVMHGDELSEAVEVSPLLRALQETLSRRTIIVSVHPEKADRALRLIGN